MVAAGRNGWRIRRAPGRPRRPALVGQNILVARRRPIRRRARRARRPRSRSSAGPGPRRPEEHDPSATPVPGNGSTRPRRRPNPIVDSNGDRRARAGRTRSQLAHTGDSDQGIDTAVRRSAAITRSYSTQSSSAATRGTRRAGAAGAPDRRRSPRAGRRDRSAAQVHRPQPPPHAARKTTEARGPDARSRTLAAPRPGRRGRQEADGDRVVEHAGVDDRCGPSRRPSRSGDDGQTVVGGRQPAHLPRSRAAHLARPCRSRRPRPRQPRPAAATYSSRR